MYEEYLKKTNLNKLICKLSQSKKRVVLYGAGLFAQELISQYDLSSLNIVGISDKKFEDSDIEEFEGYKAYKPSQLHLLEFDTILITLFEGGYFKTVIEKANFYKSLKNKKVKLVRIKKPEEDLLKNFFGNHSNDCCIICGNNQLKSFHAVIAEFLRHKMFDNKHGFTEMLYCPKCKVSYFKLRPNNEQVNAYYEDYKSEKHNVLRTEFEPDYPKVLTLEPVLPDRKIVFKRDMEVIKDKWKTFDKILDYGGSGVFFDEIATDSKQFVYDKAKKAELGKITILECLEEFDNYFNFIMSTQVLEHVSNPVEMVKEIYSKLKPGGYAYIAVPQEPNVPNNMNLIQKVQKLNHPFVMHEHINAFVPQTLKYILKNTGFKIIDCKKAGYPHKYEWKGYIYILAQK